MHLLRKAVGDDANVVEALFSKFDVDGNGTLDFQEFSRGASLSHAVWSRTRLFE